MEPQMLCRFCAGSFGYVHHPKHFACPGIANQIDSGAIPVVVKVTALDRVCCAIGVEEPDAFAALVANAGIDQPIRSSRPYPYKHRRQLNVWLQSAQARRNAQIYSRN